MLRKIFLVVLIYPLVFLWTTLSGFTGMLFSVVFRLPELTLSFVPGRMWAPVILKLLGIRLVVRGTENVKPDVPSIFVANHSSFLDIPACVTAIRVYLNFIAKKELKHTPVVGWYISATKQIFIDRKDKQKAQRSMQVAAQRIREGKHVLSYAEGTRSLDGEVKIFRRGAFIIAKDGDIPVVPVAVSGAHACLPAKSWWVNRGTITITIGEAFRPSDYPSETPEQLAERARQRVIALMREAH
jgi:1-acyl-sn-glycerol-3-phosphate acyltransferase